MAVALHRHQEDRTFISLAGCSLAYCLLQTVYLKPTPLKNHHLTQSQKLPTKTRFPRENSCRNNWL